jgi:multidrug efflux pump subunit AcrA (membrane-fusion protein)
MSMFAAKLGPLFVWQAIVLALVTVGASAVAYFGFAGMANAGASEIAEGEQLVPAQLGDLINTVSTDGSLSFTNVELTQFETTGTVGQVFVEGGDSVIAGQVLATLDAGSLATLNLRVAKAEAALRDANDKLADALEPADAQSIAKAQSAIAKAELDLEKAQDDLAVDLDLTQAQAIVTDQQANLAEAQSSLALVIDEWDTKVADAQTAQADAAGAYLKGFNRWLGVVAAALDSEASPDTNLAAIGADLAVLFPTEQNETNFALLGSTPANDPATAWNETTIFTFRTFFPGAIIGDCGSTTPLQGTCVSAEIDTLWATLKTKRTALATAQLNASRAITSGTPPVTKATDDLADAQQAFAALIAATDTPQVALARATEAVAQAGLDAANESSADLMKPAADIDINVLRQQVAVAVNELHSAREATGGSTLLSPIAGIITAVDMSVGDVASGQQSGSITITDQSVIEIAGTIDEIDVLSISEGVLAAVSLAALPGQELRGTITGIGAPSDNQGVVTFPVSITVDVPASLQLREGLSATASVVISQQLGVLLVPTSAIQGSFLAPFVRVSVNGKLIERSVELGSSDDFHVIVTSGLAENEQVVMPAPSASSTEFANFGFGGIPGGGDAQRFLRQIQSGGGIPGGGGNRSGNAGRGN